MKVNLQSLTGKSGKRYPRFEVIYYVFEDNSRGYILRDHGTGLIARHRFATSAEASTARKEIKYDIKLSKWVPLAEDTIWSND